MTWEQALGRQKFLQEKLREAQGAFPLAEQLLVAAKVELAELMQEAKAYWTWWKRVDRPEAAVDKGRVVGEAADILHFLLGAALKSREAQQRVLNALAYTPERSSPLFVVAHRCFLADRPDTFAFFFKSVLKALGVSDAELLAAYWAKTEENLRRWGLDPS